MTPVNGVRTLDSADFSTGRRFGSSDHQSGREMGFSDLSSAWGLLESPGKATICLWFTVISLNQLSVSWPLSICGTTGAFFCPSFAVIDVGLILVHSPGSVTIHPPTA